MRLLLPLSNRLHNFLVALSFLSRLGPPRLGTAAELAGGIPWYGPVGLLLGLILLCSALLACLAFATVPPWAKMLLAGWLWLALEIWLTRGLHWDGVADLGDALGSGGDRFWQILKDSRMGAFGAMALFLLMAGQALAVTAHLAAWWFQSGEAPLFPLLAAPAWGRLAPAWLAYRLPAHEPNSLGSLICSHLTRRIWLLAWLEALGLVVVPCCFGLPMARVPLLLLSQIALTSWLRSQALRQHGLSGDFLGCQIEASQLLWLIVTL